MDNNRSFNRQEQESLAIIHETEGKVNWKSLSNGRRKIVADKASHRDGPAPKKGKISGVRCSIGALDSDFEDVIENKSDPVSKTPTQKGSIASSQALIIYFAKLARAPDSELVDYKFIESLLFSGADVNATDKYGQTVLHEVSRNWHTDVAYYLLRNGSNINKTDKWGRAPLHLAAAVDHGDMVHFLLQHGANLHAKTFGELQSPIHYAAKYNAAKSLKVLLEANANVNDRDYKGRTPLFVAAEAAREDSARYLVEKGAPVGVYNETGISALSLMIEKMPNIAIDALGQFLTIDHAFRKEYYYLSYLEADPKAWTKAYDEEVKEKCELQLHNVKKKKKKKRKMSPYSPLKMAVQCEELDILMHPVIQRLIHVKWQQFGRGASILGAGFHFTYVMIWTWLGIFLPRDGIYYTPLSKNWWRILFELLGCLMTLYFILKQVWEIKSNRTEGSLWRSWKIQDIYRDMDYCHPKWPDEKTFLECELREIQRSRFSYFRDPWNVMDCLTYFAILIVIITRFLSTFLSDKRAVVIHPRAYTVALILLYIHFMKSCRPFTSLGPFIIMLGYVMQDTLRFAFLFLEFFIPYVCAFWILFGGPTNAAIMESEGADSVDWAKFNDLTFSVWQVTLIADFNLDGLYAVNRVMAQVLVGTYFAVASTICINLFIALLSETFARVYQNAKANAALLQASTILQIEKALTKEQRRKAQKYIQLDCSPLEIYQNGGNDVDDSNTPFTKLTHHLQGRIDQFEEFFTENIARHCRDQCFDDELSPKSGTSKLSIRPGTAIKRLRGQCKELSSLQEEVFEMKCRILRALGEEVPTKFAVGDDYTSDIESLAGSQLGYSAPEYSYKGNNQVGPDVIRQLLDQKLQRMGMGEEEGRKKKRKRKRKKNTMPQYLSDSWETIATADDS